MTKVKVHSRAATSPLHLDACRVILNFENGENMAHPKIVSKEHPLLDGTKAQLVQRVGDGSIIKRFDRSPIPTKPTDVVCPHFLELKWAYGCPFDCAWCYLKGTFRFLSTGTKPVIKDRKKTEVHVKAFLYNTDTPEILNTGEIADSLMDERPGSAFSKFAIPIFETQRIHKVLFVTKFDNVKNLLEIDEHRQAIISFSLNAERVAQEWEKGAPPVERRIKAARKLSEAKYEVRVRIDPMVPVANWETQYTDLIDQIFANFTPSRITLGSLRGLQSTINGSRDTSWQEYLRESSNWGKKVEFSTRYAMYTVIIEHLKSKYSYNDVALCKETKAMWENLGMNYKVPRCNCVW